MDETEREKAREFIKYVARNRGWLAPEDARKMRDVVPDAFKSFQVLREIAGNSTKA